MSEQPVNPAQPQPVVDPVQPEPNPQDQPVADNETQVPTVSAVDYDNLPQNTGGTNTPVLQEASKDESAAAPVEGAVAPQGSEVPVQTDNTERPEDGVQDVSQDS